MIPNHTKVLFPGCYACLLPSQPESDITDISVPVIDDILHTTTILHCQFKVNFCVLQSSENTSKKPLTDIVCMPLLSRDRASAWLTFLLDI